MAVRITLPNGATEYSPSPSEMTWALVSHAVDAESVHRRIEGYVAREQESLSRLEAALADPVVEVESEPRSVPGFTVFGARLKGTTHSELVDAEGHLLDTKWDSALYIGFDFVRVDRPVLDALVEYAQKEIEALRTEIVDLHEQHAQVDDGTHNGLYEFVFHWCSSRAGAQMIRDRRARAGHEVAHLEIVEGEKVKIEVPEGVRYWRASETPMDQTFIGVPRARASVQRAKTGCGEAPVVAVAMDRDSSPKVTCPASSRQ